MILSFAHNLPVITQYSSDKKGTARSFRAQPPCQARPTKLLKFCRGMEVICMETSNDLPGSHWFRQSNPFEGHSDSPPSNSGPQLDEMLRKLESNVSTPFSYTPQELPQEIRDFIGENDFKMTPELNKLARNLTTKRKQLSDEEILEIMHPEEYHRRHDDDFEYEDELDDIFFDKDERVQETEPYVENVAFFTNSMHGDAVDRPDPSKAVELELLESKDDASALQLSPRKLNAELVKKQISKLEQRKRRLAVERGVDESKALHYTAPSTGDAVFDHFVHSMRLVEREPAENFIKRSLSRARVIDFVSDAVSPRAGAMTTRAKFLMEKTMCFPFVYRPFFGLQGAFDTLDAPPCPRCNAPTPPSEASILGTICDDCYAKIYVEDPYASSSHLFREAYGSEARAEEKIAEAQTTADAVTVSKQLVNDQVTTRSSTAMKVSDTEDVGSVVDSQSLGSGGKRGTSDYSNGSSNNNNVKEPPTASVSHVGDNWNVRASHRSMRTINPIRNLVQNINVQPNPDKELIKLSVGDPTVYGNLKVSAEAVSHLQHVIQSGKANGYSMSMGSVEARAAVAKRYSTLTSLLSEDDVVLTSGASGALEIAIGALANEGDNILLPRPGFPLFQTISENLGVECRYYRVNSERSWEIELQDLMELADARTAAIVINNPSNPCGSVFSESHIEDLLAMALLLKLPIIADEVYADMVFSKQEFVSIGSKTNDVPVLSVGGVSKQFVVPGWRLGWILIHDRNGILNAGGVRKGIRQLTTRMLVPNTLVQMVLPTLLKKGTKDRAFVAVMDELRQNAEFTVRLLDKTTGLRCIRPQGAMYAMVEVDVKRMGFGDDMEFTKKLLEEEAVFVLPGQCFQAPNFVRVVFSAPREVLAEAFERIRSFCERHCNGA